MALPEWIIKRVHTCRAEGWPFLTALLVMCPRCKNKFIMPLAWKRKNDFGTAPCPYCFKTNRIPHY